MAISAVAQFTQQTQELLERSKTFHTKNDEEKKSFLDSAKSIHEKVKAHLDEKKKNEPEAPSEAHEELNKLLKTLKNLKRIEEIVLVRDIKKKTDTLISQVKNHNTDEGYKQSVQELQNLAKTFLNKKWDKANPPAGSSRWDVETVFPVKDEFTSKFLLKHHVLVSLFTILKNISEPNEKTKFSVMDYTSGERNEVEVNIATDTLGDMKNAAELVFGRKIKQIHFNDKINDNTPLRQINTNHNWTPYFTS